MDPDAERSISPGAADQLQAAVGGGETPIFIAILPASVAAEAGGDPGAVPGALAQATGLAGTYAVVVGDSFRAGSTVLRTGQAGELATSTFQATRDGGPEAMLREFVDRVQAAAAVGPSASVAPGPGATGDEGQGGGSGIWLLILLGAGGIGLFFWQRKRRPDQEARRRETETDRQMLRAELSVLGDDVMVLEPAVLTHPEARADYDAGVGPLPGRSGCARVRRCRRRLHPGRPGHRRGPLTP